jgi:methylated-DNA-[protein]-cysteine S-methyltransferase
VAQVFSVFASPVGALKLLASDAGLSSVLWENDNPNRVRVGPLLDDASHPVLVATARQLTRYFDGSLRSFTVPLDFKGTPFQISVWTALLTIPFGETRTYAEIARQIGHPTASRAVGATNGRNPISIIAPCHRVVGSTGALTGFAGGLPTKAYLLRFERQIAQSSMGSASPAAAT